MKKAPKPKSEPDYTFIVLVGLLVIFGLVMLASASSDLGMMKFGDSYHYLEHQIIFGLSFGILGFLLASFIYYHRWRKFAVPLLLLSTVALFLVFTPIGFSTKGAARWLDIGGISFQPGEAIKLAFLVYIASWLSSSKKRKKSWSEGLLPFSILVGVIVTLLLLQPSTTTAMIIFASSVAVYFMSGAKFRFVAAIVLLAALGLSLLIYTTPYRLERVQTFLNPTQDRLDSGYHINQARIAIGSGGLTGVGFGESTTKLYLPERIGDSIFAIIGEEFGFLGAGGLILIFMILMWRGFSIAKNSRDSFGRLLVMGCTTLIGLQAFINIAAISGVIPPTGVPLPFISFGGTSLAVFLTMSGIIVNVSRYRK